MTCTGPGCPNVIGNHSPTEEFCSFNCWTHWQNATIPTDCTRPDHFGAPKGVHIVGNWTTTGKQVTASAAVFQAAGLGWLDVRASGVTP